MFFWVANLCQASQGTERVTLQLRWYHQFQFAGYYAALEQGYYSKAGLDVVIVEGDLKHNAVTEVVEGRAQYGVSNAELLLHRLQGKPLVALAAIFQHSPLVLLSRQEDGITTPRDLIGQKVKMAKKSRGVELQATLFKQGVDPGQLKILEGRPLPGDYFNPEIKAVAAYITSQPYYFQKENIPYSVIRPADYGIDFYGDSLFTTEQHLRDQPDQVAAFRQASIRGWEYAMNHPEEMVELIKNRYASNASKDHLRFEAGATRELIRPDLSEIGHMNPGRWEHMAKTFAQFNMIEPGYSLKGFTFTPRTHNKGLIRIVILLLTGSTLITLTAVTLFVLNKRLQREVLERKQVQQALQESEKQLLNYARQMEQLSLSAASMIALTDEREIFAKISKVIVEFSDYNRVLISLLTEKHPFREIIGVGGLTDEMVATLKKNALPRAWYEKVFSDGERIGRLCSYVPHTNKELLCDSTTLFGSGPVPGSPDGWHPEDNLYVKMVDEKGRFIGVISVDESKSGRKPTSETVRPLEIFASLISQIIILKREHTRRRKLEVQLRQAHKMEAVGNLTSGIAHDFNNILSVIIGSLDLVDRKPLEEKNIARQLENIKSASHRAREIVQQLLTFSRQQAGQYRQVDIIPIIHEALRFLHTTIPSSIQVRSAIPLSSGVIVGDPTQILQVLTNLLINGAHAMEEKGGFLFIEVAREELTLPLPERLNILQSGPYVKIIVRDTGVGIPPETIHRIFDPYFTTKEFGRGTGLGLSISHGIVQGHNGNISVQSTLGRGSTFTIHLPLADEQDNKITADS